MTPVLVIGATGAVGAHVVRELTARGAAVRAFVRDRDRAHARLADVDHAVELAVGDLADPSSVARALDGVQRVFLCTANHPGQAEHEEGVVDAAAVAGVRRLVKVSAEGARPGSPVAFWDTHARVEEHLRASGVPWTVLRPTTYLSNLLAAAPGIAATGRLFLPAGDATPAMVDPRDVAAVAATVLTGCGHDGRSYVLTGPEAVGYGRVAAELSDLLGRTVSYVDVPAAAARAGLVESGAPEWFADQLVAIFGELRRGTGSTPTDVVRVLTGREPRTVADYLRDHAAAFGGPLTRSAART